MSTGTTHAMQNEPVSSSIRRDHALNPGKLGYRLPAEWEPHTATWLAWPHNSNTWPTQLAKVENFFVEMISLLSQHQTVRVMVTDELMEHRARLMTRRSAVGNVVFHRIRTNDAWCRDYGAIFVRRDDDENAYPSVVATDWGFNSWGNKYPPFDADNAVARQMAQVLGVPCISGGIVLEGGAIDSNGQGTLMTTRSCLLHDNRNPGIDQQAIESRLAEMFGVEHVIWLDGWIAGDDTDGHVDQLARFVAPNEVVVSIEDDPRYPNYAASQHLWQQLGDARTASGDKLVLHKLPGPAPLQWEGQYLPASYANFYFSNQLVLAPKFGHQRDQQAFEVLSSVVDRPVVQLDCQDAVFGLGSIHCLTQQQP